MGEGYNFVCPGEDHIMVTDDGAASDRADANFFLRSLLSAVAAVIDIFILTVKFLVDGICTFLIIGMFHPIVVKAEYYWSTRCWWLFLFLGWPSSAFPAAEEAETKE